MQASPVSEDVEVIQVPALKPRKFINFKWGVGNDLVLFNSRHLTPSKNDDVLFVLLFVTLN